MQTFWENLKNYVKQNTGAVIGIAITIFVTIIILMILNFVIKNYERRAKNKRAVTLARLVQSILHYIIIIIAMITIIGLLGVDITAILAGAGIVGLIIGLGSQSLISDFLGGLGIAFENYYEIDDVVEINGFKGRVIEMGLRSTKLINWKGEIKIIANGEIKEMINFSRSFSVGVVKVVISYHENIDYVISLLEEKLPSMSESFPQIIEGPNVVGVSDWKDKGIELQINAKTKPEQHYAVERALRKRIFQIFRENNIEIPYPQIVIHDDKEDDE